MNRHPAPNHLAFLDLEMTGLEPERDVILQAALLITDQELAPLEEYTCDIWQPPERLATMCPFVRNMHEKTGLLQRVAESTLDQVAAERALLERVAGWCTYPAVLCGNSVGQDKRFLERHMPGLAGYLNYRVLDVTTLKLLVRLWHGEQALYPKPEQGAHDALFDVRQSVAELKFYREKFWNKGR